MCGLSRQSEVLRSQLSKDGLSSTPSQTIRSRDSLAHPVLIRNSSYCAWYRSFSLCLWLPPLRGRTGAVGPSVGEDYVGAGPSLTIYAAILPRVTFDAGQTLSLQAGLC